MTLFTKESKTKLGVLLLLLLPCLSYSQNEAFWTEDFSDHLGSSLPPDWTTNDVSNNELKTLWQRCGIPENCPPETIVDSQIRDNFKSSTASNGYVFSFSQENLNLSEDHISQLTSPLIELPNQTDELYLEFQSFLITIRTREYEGTRLYLQADGAAWEEHTIYPEVPNAEVSIPQKTHNANTFFIDLSQYADASNIRLRWEWLGFEEVIWCLDDCKLFDYNPLNVRKIWDGGAFTGGLNDWTINNPNPEDCSWEWESIGYYGDAFLPQDNDNKFINSPTFKTGAVVVNGDYCFTENAFPTSDPELFPSFRSELISPVIDLSETTDQVLLDFYQVIRKVENVGPNTLPSPFLISFSTDNGVNWSADEQLNESFPINLTYHTHETLLLPADLIGEAEVRIKFIFDGKFFYWGLDDIRILERAENDMRISKEFFAIPPNYSTPISQLDSVVFLADVENFGTATQSDIWLHVEIENTDTDAIVHQDSLFIPLATPLQLVENQLFETSFLPPPIPARYKGTYRISSSTVDDVPKNDAVYYDFEITENSFAKEYQTSFGFTAPTRDFSWGNCYYLPNGEGYYADSIYFTIENLLDMDGKIIQVELYEFENNDMDFLKAKPDEYEQLGANIIEITANMPNLVGVAVDISGERIPLKDNTQYFAVVRYDRPPGTNQQCFLATSQESDYLAMHFASSLRSDIRYATVWKSASTDIFDLNGIGNGSGFDFVPQVRLSIKDSFTSIENTALEQGVLDLYPNPAHTNFTINLVENTKGKVLIYNKLGKLIKTINDFSTGDNISIQQLPTGTYTIHFLEDNSGRTMFGKLVKL